MNTTRSPHDGPGQAIRAMRDVAGMSRRALAAEVDCSHQHLAAIESGSRPLTKPLAHAIAQAIADHLKTDAA